VGQEKRKLAKRKLKTILNEHLVNWENVHVKINSIAFKNSLCVKINSYFL